MTCVPGRWMCGMVLACLCAPGAWAGTKEDFEATYGPQVRRAMGSPNKREAVALAEKMIDSARELQGAAELRVMMLEKAIELGLQAPSGYDAVDHAVELLLEVAPERRGEWQNRRLQILLERFKAAHGAEKQATGDEYIAYLVAVADEEVEAGQADAGIGHYRQAQEAAKKFNAAAGVDLDARIRHAEARKELEKQERALREKLKAAPADTATRDKLVWLLVLDMDAPGKAASVLADDLPETTRTYVPLAAKDAEQADEKIAGELARWYEGLVEGATAFGKVTALTRSRGYYKRFLELHTARDAEGLKASLALQKVDEKARKLGIVWAREKITFSDPKVADAVRRASKYLLSSQRSDGSWPEMSTWINGTQVPVHGVGVTALAACSLVESGADPKSPGLSKALRWLAGRPTTKTYCLAWRCTLVASLDGVARTRMLGQLRDDARRLIVNGPSGCYKGDCSGKPPVSNREGWDSLSSQYAAQGVLAASRAGLAAPPGFWNGVMKHWQQVQKDDGGWQRGFTWPGGPGPTDIGTAAGLFSCYAAINASAANVEAAKRLAANSAAVRRGLVWFDRHFPRGGMNNDDCQFLYLVSRVGLLAGKPLFGTTNWADYGTRWFLEHARRPGLEKTCPTCNRHFEPGMFRCPECHVELPQAKQPADAVINWNSNAWDTAYAILFFVNAERARNP